MTEPEAAPAFSMGEAAGFAFAKRDKRFVLLAATLTYLLIAAALCAAYLCLVRDALEAYFAWALSISQTEVFVAPPKAVLDAIPVALLFAVLGYVTFAAYEAACLRWLVRGEAGGGLFGLKLDADTARVFLTYLCWLALFVLFAVVTAVLTFVLVALLGGPQNARWLRALVPLAFYAALIFLSVRFAPAAATAVARRNLSFLQALRVTRGRFWALFGAFIFYIVIFVAIAAALYLTLGLTIMGAVLPAVTASARPDPQAIAAAIETPSVLLSILAFYAALLIGWLIIALAFFGVNAYAARAAQKEGRL